MENQFDMPTRLWKSARGFVVGFAVLLCGAALLPIIDSGHYRVDPAVPFSDAIILWSVSLAIEYVTGSILLFGIGLLLRKGGRPASSFWELASALVLLDYMTTTWEVRSSSWLGGMSWLELMELRVLLGLLFCLAMASLTALIGRLRRTWVGEGIRRN